MSQEDKKVEEIKVEAVEEAVEVPEPKEKTSAPVKSPRKSSKSSVNVKLVRRLAGGIGLFENEDKPGEMYLAELDELEPGSRHLAINPSDYEKPHDWSALLDQVLPSREQMIKDACAHLHKNGMVVLDDLNDNAIRSKAFREMLAYTIPKNPDE